jgi:TolB protein
MLPSRLIRTIIGAAALAALVAASPARAELHVTVDQGIAQPMPIAIPDFASPNPADASAGQNIARVVRADLERSGLFRPLDPKSFVEKISNINIAPQFGSWRVINAQALVAGQVQSQPDGRLGSTFAFGMCSAKAR